MKGFIKFFASRHLLAYLLTIMVMLLGAGSLMQIKRDMFPNVDFDEMIITTRYPGASPEDVELNVTNKIEDEVKEVDGIETMTSSSLENISVIDIRLDPDARDKEKIKSEIRDAIDRVTDFPPEVTEAPLIVEIKTNIIPVIRVGIAGDISYAELRLLAKRLEKKLKKIGGVSRIEKTGYLDREIKVEVSPEAIRKYQISIREVVNAIKSRNIQLSGGSFESYTSDKNIVTLAQFSDPEEVGNVIVRSTFDGPLIRVRDVARVYDGFEPEKTRFRIMGKDSISLTVFKKETADVIRLVDAVKEVVEKERKRVPEGVELLYTDDNSIFVRNRLRIVSTNALIGLTLVVILLFTFLNFRTALWVAMGIPLSISGVFFLSPFFGVYIDAIALAGMVIVVGLIVDDAIVIAENIYRHREMGDPPLTAAVEGTYKVFRPVLTTIMTTILAFAPMFFMTGIIGKFIFPIPLVMTLALLISFFEAVTILPAHISAGKDKRGLKSRFEGEKENRETAGSNWFDGVKSRFQQFVVYVLRLRYLVISIFIVLIAGSFLYASHFMKFILFPSSSAEKFFVLVETPTGTSLDATADRVKEIEKIMSGLPGDELETIWTLSGSMEGFIMGENENWALLSVSLTPYSDRERNAEEIVDSLRQKTDKLTGFASIRYVIDAGGPPVGRPITIRVVGSDNQLRKGLADSVEKYLARVNGVKDIDRDDKLGKEQVELKIDYERLSQLGLTVEDLALGVRLAYDGEVVTSVRYGDEDVDFRVILEKMARREPGYLRSLNIPNRQGRLIPLSEVAGFVTGPGPSSFYHFDGERAVTITADIAKGGLTPLEATEAVIDHFDLDNDWPGMRFEIGGEAEETQKSMKSLAIAMVTSVVGIYFILVLLFNSLTQPILVMLAIPFGLIGVIGAFAAHGEPLGFLAMLGVIGLMGVVVNDSLILVDYINVHRLEEPEKKFLRIVAEGTSARLRPILLTSVTTVSGVLPMAYGLGGSDPFLAPMALALGYGILFATPLTLLLLPCLYMIPNDVREIAAWIRRVIARKRAGTGTEDSDSAGK